MRPFCSLTTLLLAGLPVALAHTVVCNVFVDSVDQGDGQGKYIRSPPNTDPVKDIASPDLNCNVNGGTAVPSFVSVDAGQTLTFEWRRINRGDDILDPSHLGPIITYITPFVESQPSSGVWTKIHEEGFDAAAKKWAVEKLLAQGGKWDFTLPDIKPGKYLVRQEIIALHEANTRFDEDPKRGAQFYPSCVQVEVGGSGTREPDQGFDLNTGYSVSDPGIFFNILMLRYPIPGPPVWDGVSSSGNNTKRAPADSKARAVPVASTLITSLRNPRQTPA